MTSGGAHDAIDTVDDAAEAPMAPDDRLPHPPTDERWRPGLDGLRAIAVLAVMAYHEPDLGLAGGFLGVDLFFVLSGFLITGLLLDEHHATGTLSLRGFWNRRGRRLLPALAALLVVVIVATRVLGDAKQRHDLPVGVLAAVLYISNWIQVAAKQSYFAQFLSVSPLRHLWSLAIEEQFYIVWPLAVLACIRRSRRLLVAVTVVATIASIIAMAVLFVPGDPSRAYYGTETRAFSLLIGALGAMFAWHRHPSGRRATIVGAIAGVGVLAAFVFVHDTDAWMYRGGFALFAVVALALIIGASGRSSITRVLSWPLLRRIGMLSYALYLWHWPIRVYVTDARLHLGSSGRDQVIAVVIRLALTFTFAIASMALIETRVRRSLLAGLRLAGSWVVIGAICIGLALVWAPPKGATIATVADDPNHVQRTERLDGGPSTMPTVMLVGDSLAVTLAPGLKGALGPTVGFIPAGELGCALLVSDAAQQWDGSWKPVGSECPDHDAYWRRLTAARRPEVVVLLTGAWDVDNRRWGGGSVAPGDAEFDDHYRAAVEGAVDALASTGATVVIMTPPCFAPNAGEARRSSHDPARADRLAEITSEVVASRAALGVDVVTVPFHELTCTDGFTSTLDGVAWRPDGVHFSVDGSNVAGRWLVADLPPAVRSRLGLAAR